MKLHKLLSKKKIRQSSELRNQGYLLKVPLDSLLFYYGNIHSQRGQDGILAEIFRRLGLTAGQFVEFGGWDGIYLSNSRFLFEKGWSGVFIECDAQKFNILKNNYADTDVICINKMVGTEPGSRLIDILLADKIAPDQISFVSIDVDGPDLTILSNLGFCPPVILIEGGFAFSPLLNLAVSEDIANQNIQQPLPIICKIANELGYTPVCFDQDTFLVRKDLSAPFRIKTALELYEDAFNFMSDDYRNELLTFRANNHSIRSVEEQYFGIFRINPLDY